MNKQKFYGGGFKYPKYVRFEDSGSEHGPNFCFLYEGDGVYLKCYGGWSIQTQIIDGRIYAKATYPQVEHLDDREFIACTEEELKLDKDYINR